MSEYYCKWCGGYHPRKRAHLYCEKNPDGKENYEKLVARNKEIYEKYAKKRILETSHTPEASKKRKASVAQRWKEGTYDDIDFGGRFKGKKHTLTHRVHMSKLMSSIWQDRMPQELEKNLERHNVIQPIVPMVQDTRYMPEKKTLVGGEFFEEDFFDYYEDDDSVF